MVSHLTRSMIVVGVVVFGLTAGDAMAMACCGGGQPTPQKKPGASNNSQKPEASTGKKSLTVYTCTMDPEVLSTKPGPCPKCKMALVKTQVTGLYTCPMHSDVLSLQKGKCPKCGMSLQERKRDRPSQKQEAPNAPAQCGKP